MSYELFYSNGGHVGGFGSKLEAKFAALQRLAGDRSLDWVAVKTSSINGVEVARVTHEDLCIFIDEFAKTIPPTTRKNNVAIFTVETTVILAGVSGAELENSEVLHPDVLDRLNLAKVTITNAKITLDEVYEVEDGNMKKWR